MCSNMQIRDRYHTKMIFSAGLAEKQGASLQSSKRVPGVALQH